MSFFPRTLWLAIVISSVLCLAAGQSGSSSSRRSHPVHSVTPAPDLGALADNLYRNRFFAFSYKVPFGWVDRTQDMRQDSMRGEGNTPAGTAQLLLLSVFERPPEATGATVNSSVLIAAESVSTYPGLKDASQYFGPLTEVITAKGFKAIHEPYDAEVGGKRLVRADFSKDLGKLTMYQSTLAMIDKGYVVSFTCIGGSEDEVQDLIGNLAFSKSVQR